MQHDDSNKDEKVERGRGDGRKVVEKCPGLQRRLGLADDRRHSLYISTKYISTSHLKLVSSTAKMTPRES